jgi:hypothetical protein
MEQLERRDLKNCSLPQYSALGDAGHHLAAAEDMVDANYHWSISPAWCYAMAIFDQLEEERCSKKSIVRRMAATTHRGCLRFVLSIILLFLLSTPAGSACVDDVLETVDRDRLVMDSQAIYRVLDNRRAAVFWLPLSEVTICDPLDSGGDEVVIYEIRNHDDNQVVQAIREG